VVSLILKKLLLLFTYYFTIILTFIYYSTIYLTNNFISYSLFNSIIYYLLSFFKTMKPGPFSKLKTGPVLRFNAHGRFSLGGSHLQ
jgi:hypothetical protein